MRTAGGTTWEDQSLTDWQEDDFRIFCGDLGNDVTDELLTRTFNKFPSFLRARVVRDKRTNKTKGYGFISFKDPSDFTKAMKEMNGELHFHNIFFFKGYISEIKRYLARFIYLIYYNHKCLHIEK